MNPLEQFLKDPTKEFYIRCSTIKNRNSVRAGLFYKRRLMGKFFVDTIGIRNEMMEGVPYVVIYSKTESQLYFKKVDGVLVPVEKPEIEDIEEERIRELMKADGCSEEEIQETLTEMRQRGKEDAIES